MDTMRALEMARAASRSGARMRVFDWHKAAQLIRDRRPSVASAGLKDDWDFTGGVVYHDGAPVSPNDSQTFLASLWAVPLLEMDGESVECWTFQDESPGWDSSTFWPESAKKILNEPTA